MTFGVFEPSNRNSTRPKAMPSPSRSARRRVARARMGSFTGPCAAPVAKTRSFIGLGFCHLSFRGTISTTAGPVELTLQWSGSRMPDHSEEAEGQ